MKRTFTDQFKRDTVKKLLERAPSATANSVAEAADVTLAQIYKWKKQLGAGRKASPVSPASDVVATLRRENERLAQEVSDLRRVVHFFVREHGR